MANFYLAIQYDGTRYNGWQKQGNTANTIQGKIEIILESMYQEPVDLNGSGRTDAGVHALCQSANFRVPRIISRYSCQQVRDTLNEYLPLDIRVLDVVQMPERFHARLNAVSKIYEYRIDCGTVANVFERRYLTRVEDPLNLALMEEAAGYLTGTHDFKSFCDNGRMKKSSVRTIHSIRLDQDGGILRIRYHGDGFLYHMVRILTGTLLEVGTGDLPPARIPQILEEKDRSAAGFTAPPQGLFLMEVLYE